MHQQAHFVLPPDYSLKWFLKDLGHGNSNENQAHLTSHCEDGMDQIQSRALYP